MNKKFFSAIVISLMMVTIIIPAAAQNQKFRVRVVAEQANLRVKPDIASEMLFQVPEGTELEAEKKEGEWYLVLYDRSDGTKGRGYVHESLVEVIQPEKPLTGKVTPAAREESKKVEKPAAPREKTVAAAPTRQTPATSRATIQMRDFSLEVTAGGFYVKAAEINQAAQGVVDYYQFYLGENGRRTTRPLHLGLNYGAEVFYRVHRYLLLGLGFEYQQRETTSKLEYANGTDLAYAVLVKKGIKDLPLRLSVVYEPDENFYVKAGIEYHLAKFNYIYSAPLSLDQPAANLATWQGRTSGNSLGWMEAVGYRRSLTSWLKMFVEGSYHYVRIKNFEGTNTYTNTLGVSNQEKGKLYQWDVQVNSGRTFPVLFVRESTPAEPGVLNVRTANLSFSGFTLRLGFRLEF